MARPSSAPRLAVIGCGRMGSNHARLLAGMGRLAGVVDADPAVAEAAATRFGTRVLALPDLGPEVDGAVIAAATSAHTEIAGALLQAGVPVLVEKPLALDHASAAPLVALAKSRGLPLAVGMVERFNPGVAALIAWLGHQRIDALEARRLNPGSGRIIDASVVADLMIHDLDIVLHLIGRTPTDARAISVNPRGGSADHAVATLTWPGATASLTASRISHVRARELTVWAEDGTAVLDFTLQEVAVHDGDGRRVLQPGRADQLTTELEAFLAYIATGEPSGSVTGDDALATLAVLDRLDE
jgi:predicted dehydrogenase